MSDASSSARKVLRSILSQAPWAEHCAPSTLELFASQCVIRHLKRGELFVRVGDPIDVLVLVIEGTLQVGHHSSDGQRFISGYLKAGEFGNLVPFLDRNDTALNYLAHNDTTVALLHRPLVEKSLQSDFGFTQGILSILCQRARHNFSERADLMLLTLRQRCAKVLLRFAADYGEPHSAGVSLSLRLSQAELADLVGWSRPVVNRELKKMEKEGLLQLSYSHMIIRDLPGLTQIAKNQPQ